MIITPGSGEIRIGSGEPAEVIVAPARPAVARVLLRRRLAYLARRDALRRGLGAVASTGPPADQPLTW